MKLTEAEAYALARVLHNLPTVPNLPLSSRVQNAIQKLSSIPVRERFFVAPQYLSASELQQVQLVNPNNAAPVQTLELLTVHQLMALPPIRWIIPPEVPAGMMVVVYGESGVGKSFIVLDYALRAASKGNVIYIPTEGVSGYGKRVTAWATYHQRSEPQSIYFLRSGINLYDRASVVEKAALLAAAQPVMIVIDTLAMSMIGADENSSRDMGIALASCRLLIEQLKCTVVLVHHMGKAGLSERGSSALRGNADVMIRVGAADDVLQIECTKAKDFEPFPKRYVRLEPVGTASAGSLVVVNHNFQDGERKTLTKTQRVIIETLTLETCINGVTLRELAELTSTPFTTLHRAVSALIRNTYVERGRSGYRLTDAGRALVGLDPLVSPVKPTDPTPVSPHDPLIRRSSDNDDSVQMTIGSLDQTDQRSAAKQYYMAGL